jgi:phosphate starvation-inducible protein PhoH and related proteins
MSEATITFDNHEHIRTLFGARDQYLRQVRESVGVDVVLRGDELRLQGDDEQIRRGLEVFTELQAIIRKKGRLRDEEVERVLTGNAIAARAARDGNGEATIDLFEKARRVHPRTPGQADYAEAIRNNDLVFCSGPAGCGKTYLSVAMAINALRQEQVRKIVLVRPAVEAGEKLGFLPGDIFAKVNPYLRPLLDALNDMLDFDTVKRYMEKDVIEIVPLAFMRGRTLNNTFIILDEAQNTTVTQMKMFLTRMGHHSKIVVTGDTTQVDLPPHVECGLIDAMERLADIDGVALVELTSRDIVRHRLVRDVVHAYDRDSRRKAKKK